MSAESGNQDERARQAEAAERERRQFELERLKAQLEYRKLSWSTDRIRGAVSLMLVAGFLITTLIVIFFDAYERGSEDLLQTVSTLYSGITGAVLGYYFGKQQES